MGAKISETYRNSKQFSGTFRGGEEEEGIAHGVKAHWLSRITEGFQKRQEVHSEAYTWEVLFTAFYRKYNTVPSLLSRGIHGFRLLLEMRSASLLLVQPPLTNNLASRETSSDALLMGALLKTGEHRVHLVRVHRLLADSRLSNHFGCFLEC